jgi:hypothetical protein
LGTNAIASTPSSASRATPSSAPAAGFASTIWPEFASSARKPSATRSIAAETARRFACGAPSRAGRRSTGAAGPRTPAGAAQRDLDRVSVRRGGSCGRVDPAVEQRGRAAIVHAQTVERGLGRTSARERGGRAAAEAPATAPPRRSRARRRASELRVHQGVDPDAVLDQEGREVRSGHGAILPSAGAVPQPIGAKCRCIRRWKPPNLPPPRGTS